VLVEVSCELDPTLNLRVDRGTGEAMPEPGDVARRIKPSGSVAVDVALELARTAAAGCVVGFALGGGHEAALHDALARGAERALSLSAEPGGGPPGERRVAEWLRAEQADLVLMGHSAGAVAARVGWAHLAGLDQLRLRERRLYATRNLGRGDREEVESALPAVVRIEINRRPVYIARARLRAAARDHAIGEAILPGPDATLPAAVVAGPLSAARARTRLGAAAVPPPASTRASGRLQSLMAAGGNKAPVSASPKPGAEAPATPEAQAESFVRYLAHHNLLVDGS
jgi:electron transfer flavoprotein alpha/beta subunit